MKTRWKLSHAVIMIAGTLGLLADCSSPTIPEQTPKPTAGSPPPVAPSLPEEARKQTLDGARAFVEHYYDLIRYGDTTGDWAPVKNESLDSCHTCQELWAPKQSRRIDHDNIEVEPRDASSFHNDHAEVDVVVPEISVGGNASNARIARRWIDRLDLVYREHAWLVEDLEIEKN